MIGQQHCTDGNKTFELALTKFFLQTFNSGKWKVKKETFLLVSI